MQCNSENSDVLIADSGLKMSPCIIGLVPKEFLVSGEETQYVGPVCLYVCHSFLIFQKRGFESTNSILSNTTKLILLDSLLQVFAYHRSHASVLY